MEISNQQSFQGEKKVTVNLNPYFYTDTQVSVTTIEQVEFYSYKINQNRVLGEFLKDKRFSRFKRKRILKSVMKVWEKDFKKSIKEHKDHLLEKVSKVKRRKIKKIDHAIIYIYGAICLVSIMVLQGFLTFTQSFLDHKLYHNLLIVLIYLTLVACLYMIIIKTYFETIGLVGIDSKKFIEHEFKNIKRNFKTQHKGLKKHLYKYIQFTHFKQHFHLKKLYDPMVVILRIEKYRLYIEDKMALFSKYYYMILIFSFLLKLSVLILVTYLLMAFLSV